MDYFTGGGQNQREQEAASGEITNIHIVFTNRIDLDVMELQAHYLSCFNLSLLCGKVLTYAENANKKRYYDKSACDHCSRLFNFEKSRSVRSQMRKQKNDFDSGNIDDKTSQAFLDHVANCKYMSLTSTTLPEEGSCLTFKNQKALHHKPVTIITDFEASHCSLSHICTRCMTLYKASRGSQRLKILDKCRERGHIKMPGGPKCDSCIQHVEERMEEMEQSGFCPPSHDKMQFLSPEGRSVSHPFCASCLDTMAKNPLIVPECEHSRTTPNSSLEIISFCIIVVENYGPLNDKRGNKISYPHLAKEVTYVGDRDEKGASIMKKFWSKLAGIRGFVARKWKGAYRTLQESPLSPEEQADFDAAKSCYGCRKSFEVPLLNPIHDSVNSIFPPYQKTGVKKVRDHCHRSGVYRGALCNTCNLRLEDGKRPNVDVFAHNSTFAL